MTPEAIFGLTYGPVVFAAVLALVSDMLSQRSAGRFATALLLAAAGSISLVAGVPTEPQLVHGAFTVGGGYSTITGVSLLLAALVLVASSDRVGSVPALIALSVGGATLAATTTDLVALLVSLEIAAMCGYALVSSARTVRSDEASMKYFVQGAVATGLFVLGLAVLVGVTGGTASTAAISNALGLLGGEGPALLGVMALVAALAFKSGVAPFHSWAPDAYENAPAPSSGFLSGPVKLSMIVALAIFASSMIQMGVSEERPLGLVGLQLLTVLGVLAIVSVVVGSTVALRTDSYTRMLGYAGIAQAGYALIALTALQPSLAALFATTYAIGTTGAFVAAEVFRRRRPDWDGTVSGLAGIAREEPLVAAALTVLLMSLAGIPPLIGFWGKLQAFGAAIGSATQLMAGGFEGLAAWLAALAVVGIVGSIVSLGYYGAVIRSMYFDAAPEVQPGETSGEPDDAGPRAARGVVIALAAASLILGLVPLVIGVSAAVDAFLLG